MSSTISQLLSALQSKNLTQTTVMGPQCASQIEDLSTQEFNEIKKTKSPEDFATQIYEKIIQPALAHYEVDRKHEQDQINEQIQAIQKQITKETGTKREQAKEKFDNSMEVIINIIQKMKKIESRLRRNTKSCLLYTSPSPRDLSTSRMPSSA